MQQWIISIIGIVFVLLILDLILPSGSCKKIIQSVISIFFLCIFFSPLKSFISKTTSTEFSVDDGLYTTINLAKVQSIKDRILNELRSSGIKDVNVDIVTNTANIDFDIKYVYVDVSNLSLSDNSQHINTNEVIKSVVIKISKVREEQVIIYG